MTPSNVQPATTPGDNLSSFYFLHPFLGHLHVCFIYNFFTLIGATIKVIKFTKLAGAPAAGGQVVSSLVQPTKTFTIQNNITNRAPAPFLSQTVRPQAQIFAPPLATTTTGQDQDLFLPSVFNYCIEVLLFLDVDISLLIKHH